MSPKTREYVINIARAALDIDSLQNKRENVHYGHIEWARLTKKIERKLSYMKKYLEHLISDY
jgi:hypothetical protein